MKRLFLFLILITGSNALFAQNPIFLTAPYYTDIQSGQLVPLPINPDANVNYYLDPFDYYDGNSAIHSSIAIPDADGNLKFFIIDGLIYDKNGKYIDYLFSPGANNYPATPYIYDLQTNSYTGYTVDGSGGTELVMVPHPTNCNQYYFFYNTVSVGTFESLSSAPGYMLYDFCTEEHVLYGPWYSSYNQDNNTNTVNEIFSYDDGPSYDTQINGAIWGEDINKKGVASIGATVIQDDGTRFVICRLGWHIYMIKISATGSLSYQKRYTLPYINYGPTMQRSELEVYQDPITKNFKIAYGAYNTDYVIQVLHLSPDMLTPVAPPTTFFLPNNGNLRAPIHGVEFSPDGEKLYFSYTPSYPGVDEVRYIDFSGFNPTFNNLGLSNNLPLEFSGIEMGIDGKMYFASQDGLYSLADPNNPNPANFSSTPDYAFSYDPTYSIPNLTHQTYETRMYSLPDQIDGMDYSAHYELSAQCCKDNRSYEARAFDFTGNEIWTPGGTSSIAAILTNDIFIKEELRVKAGSNLTLQGINVHFAPGARLVVENGNGLVPGGKLTLDGATLTIDDRCGTEELWLGVEVWGNQNSSQNNSQGRLIMINSSKIEHAWIGVLVSKRTSTDNPELECGSDFYINPFSFDNNRNGGVVTANNCLFHNNQRGVLFMPYLGLNGTSGPNNQSYFSETTFEWDGLLIEGNAQTHARLEQVKGVSFKACDFKSVTPGLYNDFGFGILARESQFYVSSICSSIGGPGVPCPTYVPSTFTNLKYGIYASNSNLLSFTCRQSEFLNNRYGIFVRGTQLEKIHQNNFEIKESDQYQSAGLAMYSSTGYHVEDNDFAEFDDVSVPNGTSQAYGIVINNSGAVHNEIYRNRFHNLKIGGQTERLNAIEITAINCPECQFFNMEGLTWKCNDFQSSIEDYDMTLMYGRMHYNQGYAYAFGAPSDLEVKRQAARNKFSLTSEPFADQHDLFSSSTSQLYTYAHLNAPRHEPDSWTPSLVGPIQTLTGTLMPIYDEVNACPSKLISKTPIIAVSEMAALKEEMGTLNALLDGDDQLALLELIATGSNGQIKDELLLISPYLSDEVLLAYIASNPPNGNLLQVMIANSQLSEQVKAALVNSNLPNGVVNQIATAQVGWSGRTDLYMAINYLKEQYEGIYYERIRDALLDEDPNADLENLISILLEEGDRRRLELLLSTCIVIGDLPRAATARQQLSNLSPCQNFMDLTQIQESICLESSSCEAIESNQALKLTLESIRDNSMDECVAARAACLLEIHEYDIIAPLFLDENTPSGAKISGSEDQNKIDLNKPFIVNIYPNPTTGEVFFDYPDAMIGKMEIQIMSMNGKLMMQFESENTNGERLDLSQLSKGLYLVKIKIDGVEMTPQRLELI